MNTDANNLNKIFYLHLQYDLSEFCPYNTVLVDHGDPSINTGTISLYPYNFFL